MFKFVPLVLLLSTLFMSAGASAEILGPFHLGGTGYTSVPGDFDGDGLTDPAVYENASGTWFAGLSGSQYALASMQLGGPGLIPLQGDFDGDGKADPAVYASGTHIWQARLSGSGYQPAQEEFGADGFVPATGDYDGDGRTDAGLYHVQDGNWYVQPSGESGPATVGDVASLRSALEHNGFTVQVGVLTNVSPIDLFNDYRIVSCYGFNNDSPYMVFMLPDAPGQTVSNTTPWGYRLGEDEAIIFIGKTPPPCIYFSYRTYLGIRYIPEFGIRRRLYASLGDTINNFSIRTAGTPNGRPGNAFAQDMIVICTADRSIDTRVRQVALTAGYSAALINTDVIPSSMCNMGLESTDDEFTFLHRTAFFLDDAQAAAYVANPPGTVFRLTPSTSAASDPMPLPALRVRGTGTTEYDLNTTLATMRDAILAAHPGYTSTQLITSVWLPEGFDGIQRNQDVLGECRDTVYLSTECFTLASNEFVIAYGVNHAASGKATYANINVYSASVVDGVVPETRENAGITSVNTVRHLAGTADDYIAGHPLADKFYAYKIAWSNPGNDPHCLVIPQPYGRLKMETLFLAFRTYIEPGSAVGPAASELLYDRAILFRPQ